MIGIILLSSLMLFSKQPSANKEDPNLKSPPASSSQLMNVSTGSMSSMPSETNQFHCPGVVLDAEAVVQAMEGSDEQYTEAED